MPKTKIIVTSGDNGGAKIREVYELFNQLKDNFDTKIDPIEKGLTTLITKVEGFMGNCVNIQNVNAKRIEYENGQFGAMAKMKIKVYGLVAGISVFSVFIGSLIGKFWL